MKKMKLGIIGCGTIGSQVANACLGPLKESFELEALCDSDVKAAIALKDALKFKKEPQILKVDDLIKKCGFVLEAASANISGGILSECIRAGRDCMIMSVGGLIGREKLLKEASDKGVRVYIPSGALCGIDGLKSASIGRIDSVTLTTRKPPKGLEGAPYLKARNINIADITAESLIFEGTAEEAIEAFPQNVNVSAVMSIAGIGAKRTRVRIFTAPEYTRNIHEVEIEGEFGRISTRTENVPSQANPKTSEMAILSAIATLAGIANSVRVGT